MKLIKIAAALAVIAFAQGCVKGKALVDLNDSQIDTVCANAEQETVMCEEGVEVTTSGPDECVAAINALTDDCEATVGDYQDCNDADPCNFDEIMTACEPITACVTTG